MASLFQIGVSGLLSNQRALATVGHNVANVNTPGYSRQRVELEARPPQAMGGMFFGRGVAVAGVERIVDGFLDQQLRVAVTNQSEARVFQEYAGQVNNLLGDSAAGLSPALSAFFASVQDLADDPASVPARQVLLSEAGTLAARLHDHSVRLDEIAAGINQRLRAAVDEVNSIAGGIADLNRDIVRALGASQGQPPNDLLDRRDALIGELAQFTEVHTIEQDDGALNVTIGKGQALVAGGTAQRLAVIDNPLDPSRKEIAYQVGGTQSVISQDLAGGTLGGVLGFRDAVLDPARNAVGRIAVALAATFNEQHRAGMDLDGNLGGDFFTMPAPVIRALPGNAGTVSVAFDAGAPGALTGSDYELIHDGSDFILRRLSDGSTQTLAGGGPFTVDGLDIAIGAPPAAGDRYLIQPTRDAAKALEVAVGGVREIAAAAPIRAGASLGNVSDAAITAGEVLDATDPALLTPVTLVFNDPPATYQVNGAGPLLPYSSGASIDLNGWRVQISGTPAPGDQFTVGPNTGGVGDNRNALALAGLQDTRLLDAGTATYHEAYASLVGETGARARQAEVAVSALDALASHAREARSSVSGVNLDEEAANLLRFQQAYEAAAQIVAAAQSSFDALLRAVGR